MVKGIVLRKQLEQTIELLSEFSGIFASDMEKLKLIQPFDEKKQSYDPFLFHLLSKSFAVKFWVDALNAGFKEYLETGELKQKTTIKVIQEEAKNG